MNVSISEVVSAQQSATRGERLFSLLAMLAKAVAILASAGAVSLHLIGYVAQQSYLRAFNIDPDGFPRAMDWILINGYYSVLDILIFSVGNVSFSIMAALLALIFIAIIIVRWTPQKRDVPSWIKWISKYPRVKFFIDSLFFSIISIVSAYQIFMFALLVVIVPAIMGQSFGNRAAKVDIALYAKGCAAKNPCSQIWMNGSPLAKGFIIATSDDRLAFYDVEVRMVRQMERSGMELRTAIDPKLTPNEAK